MHAKLGDEVILDVPVDQLYLVGKAKSYTTVLGRTSHAILLLPLAGLEQTKEIDVLVRTEMKTRARALTEAKTKEEQAKRAKGEKRYLSKLRHTFRDITGKFQVDAAPIAVNEESVELIRIKEKRKISLPISKLSDADRKWLVDNASWIKVYGPLLERLYEQE